MTHYKVVQTLFKKSNITNDNVDLDFHFRTISGVDATNTEGQNLAEALEDFLGDTATGSTHPVDYYMGNTFKRTANGAQVQLYKMPGARGPLGVPVQTWLNTITNGGGGLDLPAEVALCLSFHGDYGVIPEHGAGGTRPKARWRNRVYLGPVTDASEAIDGTTGEVTPSALCRADITRSANQFLLTDANAAGWQWEVFSPTDWAWHDVVGGWMDNAYDSQRRRGIAPTTKTLFP